SHRAQRLIECSVLRLTADPERGIPELELPGTTFGMHRHVVQTIGAEGEMPVLIQRDPIRAAAQLHLRRPPGAVRVESPRNIHAVNGVQRNPAIELTWRTDPGLGITYAA